MNAITIFHHSPPGSQKKKGMYIDLKITNIYGRKIPWQIVDVERVMREAIIWKKRYGYDRYGHNT